ncbi:MAG: hypothetical protein IRZ14_17760 [Chloroflexi bacterium]|nr:hypothetical protein [Chloroflexota bacterium]
MDAALDTELAREEMTYLWAIWAKVAAERYGFDERTAQRLVFIRWLVQTARLSDEISERAQAAAE